MTKSLDDPIFDDLFLGCAFAAYVELAIQCGGVPDQDTTRQLAYRYYEEELVASTVPGKEMLRSSPVGCTMCSQKGCV